MAQASLFADGFEHGDTAAWSLAAPARCDEISTFDRNLMPSSEIHVAPPPLGNDTTGNGSAESPFATPGRAAQAATPGTAIRLHPGTYGGGHFLDDLTGTMAAPIWIGGLPGAARPVFQGGSEGLHFVRAKWVVVHDLEIRNATANGLNADDGGEVGNALASHHLIFRRLSIHDIGSGGNNDCLKLSGINDFVVQDGFFARCGGSMSGSGIDCVGCHRGVIARNRFEQNSGNAIQAKGGSEDLEMRWNHLVSPGERGFNLGGSTGFEFFRPPLSMATPNAEARNLRVLANVIEGGTAAIAFVGCVDCVAAHNTIVHPTRWLMRILQETTTSGGFTFEPAKNGQVFNNLFLFTDAAISTHLNIGANTDPGSFDFSHNLWYASDVPAASQPTLPSAEIGGIYGQNPLLASDFSIPSNSPAAGAGAVQAWITGDGNGLCYASPPSVGAREVP